MMRWGKAAVWLMLGASVAGLAYAAARGPFVRYEDYHLLRGVCASLSPGLIFWGKVSEFALWISYTVIMIFMVFWVAPRHLPRIRLWFNLLGFLFLTCAGTHFNGWLMFYWPNYYWDTDSVCSPC